MKINDASVSVKVGRTGEHNALTTTPKGKVKLVAKSATSSVSHTSNHPSRQSDHAIAIIYLTCMDGAKEWALGFVNFAS